jgi:hypothetical protein
MAWVPRVLPARNVEQESHLVGLDLNASRARAVYGPAQAVPAALPLEGAAEDLPMALSLEGRRPAVGRAGASLSRQAPHLACLDFLAALGEQREWVIGRHRLDAGRALSLVLEKVQTACAGAKGLLWSVPTYLSRSQVALVIPLARKARLPLLGSVRGPLALALACYSTEPWSGTALVLDVDDHAFTATTVVADDAQLAIQSTQAWTQLNLRTWKGRLIDVVAERCVRQSRRDPRDSAPAEQALYEQLDDALGACAAGRTMELLIQTPNWYQNLSVRPEEMAKFCARLVQQVIDSVRGLMSSSPGCDMPRAILLTRTAGNLPGLPAALSAFVNETPASKEIDVSDDFGEGLLQPSAGPSVVTVLGGDASARAAHYLATRVEQNELARGFHDFVIPLPRTDVQNSLNNPGRRSFRILSPDQP